MYGALLRSSVMRWALVEMILRLDIMPWNLRWFLISATFWELMRIWLERFVQPSENVSVRAPHTNGTKGRKLHDNGETFLNTTYPCTPWYTRFAWAKVFRSMHSQHGILRWLNLSCIWHCGRVACIVSLLHGHSPSLLSLIWFTHSHLFIPLVLADVFPFPMCMCISLFPR